jgi:hypothetical protein
MKIKSAKSFRYWYKTNVKKIDKYDENYDENFVGTYYGNIKGFFEMYHGHKPDIAGYLPSILKIAEDGQAIYEFLQNAVDCNSTHFYVFYNKNYFLAINNGEPFDIEGLQSILNIAQTTKKDADKIGKFGIGFKLAHRLVGKNEGTDELLNQYKGPILFSWSKMEDLKGLLNKESIKTDDTNIEQNDAPYLMKLLLTNFPTEPNEVVKNLQYEDCILFSQEELNEMVDFLSEKFQSHSKNFKLEDLNQGSMFFIKLGEGKKLILEKDDSNLVNGIQYSMNMLKKLQKVYINEQSISKIALQLESGSIAQNSKEFDIISPENKDFAINFTVGFNKIKFGNEYSYDEIKKIKETPNFYKYFPLGDEINHFGFMVHCDSFSNEANRRKLHEDDINKNLFPQIAEFITSRLNIYLTCDRQKFLNLYACLLLSDIPDRQNNKWLKNIFFDILLTFLKKNVPTIGNNICNDPQSVKVNHLKTHIDLADVGLKDIQWFEWNDEKNDKYLLNEAENKLEIKRWDIRDIVENSNLENLNKWLANCDEQTYNSFLDELNNSELRSKTKQQICNIKLFKFSNGKLYSFNEIVSNIVNGYSISVNYKQCDIILCNDKLFEIKSELQKLGFVTSEKKISDYDKIYSSIKMPAEKLLYNFIVEKCKRNTLSPQEKKNLFKALIDFGVDNETLKKLELFCNSDCKIKPLGKLISKNVDISGFLKKQQVKNDEYFDLLEEYLINSKKDAFTILVKPNIDNIVSDNRDADMLKAFIELCHYNQESFFKKYIIRKNGNTFSVIEKSNNKFQFFSDKETSAFIEENCSDVLIGLPSEFKDYYKDENVVSGDELHCKILDCVDVDTHKETLVDIVKYKAKYEFLKKLSEIRLVSEADYTQDSFEYKILEMACDVIISMNDSLKFREKTVIEQGSEELKLSDIPSSANKIILDGKTLLLSEILPNEHQNGNILSVLFDKFISLGLQKDKLNLLFGIEPEADPEQIFALLKKCYSVLENEQQLAFLILYNKTVTSINFEEFKVEVLGAKNMELRYSFYLQPYSFIGDDYILKSQYAKIGEYINLPCKYGNGESQIFSKPQISQNKIICPGIKSTLSDKERIELLDLLNDLLPKQLRDLNLFFIHLIDWSKINDIETSKLFGFNPNHSVFPDEYACSQEKLPEYLLKWIGKAPAYQQYEEIACYKSEEEISRKLIEILKRKYDLRIHVDKKGLWKIQEDKISKIQEILNTDFPDLAYLKQETSTGINVIFPKDDKADLVKLVKKILANNELNSTDVSITNEGLICIRIAAWIRPDLLLRAGLKPVKSVFTFTPKNKQSLTKVRGADIINDSYQVTSNDSKKFSYWKKLLENSNKGLTFWSKTIYYFEDTNATKRELRELQDFKRKTDIEGKTDFNLQEKKLTVYAGNSFEYEAQLQRIKTLCPDISFASQFVYKYSLQFKDSISGREQKLQFLSDLGMWTENSIIVDLRKFFAGEIDTFESRNLLQEQKFNSDALILKNSLLWVIEQKIELSKDRHFEALEQVIKILKPHYQNELSIDFDFNEIMNNSEEWDDHSYTEWKSENSDPKYIYLYRNGELPKTVKISNLSDAYDGNSYVFIRFNEGNIARKLNKIYINADSNIREELYSLVTEIKDLEQLLKRFLTEIDKHATIVPHHSNGLSKQEKIEINIEAKEIVISHLLQLGFTFPNGLNNFSTLYLEKDGITYPVVIKSYKKQDEPFMLGVNELMHLMQERSMLWVYFGNNKVGCLNIFDLFKDQSHLTLTFSTENINKKQRMNIFEDLLNYCRGLQWFNDIHFDFDSFAAPYYRSSAAKMEDYHFNTRKAEEDITDDDSESML